MKRRVFNILAAVSLVLCLPVLGAWTYGSSWESIWYWDSNAHVGVADTGFWIEMLEASPPTQVVPSSFAFLGFKFWRRTVGAMHAIAQLRTRVVIPFWFALALTAILPVIWIRRWSRHRRAEDDGMPHCAKCDYNLTGNVSGICPECGTLIQSQAKQEEMDR